jgi:hypothetical protein
MGISEICHDESERIRSDWQDRSLSQRWATVADAVGVLVSQSFGL